MRASTRIDVVKGQYHIRYRSGAEPFGASTADNVRLLHTDPDGEKGYLLILPGMFDGDIDLTLETGSDVTTQDDADWEIVEHADITGHGEDLQVWILFGGTADLPTVSLPTGRLYRLSLYARGVAEAIEVHMLEPDADPVEHHLIQLVPI